MDPQPLHPQAQTDRHEEENTKSDPRYATLLAIAEAAHEANRALQRLLGDPVNPPWAEAGRHLKDSTLDGVKAILAGEVTRPEQSHENWLEYKQADGWVYGLEKNERAKTHPCLVPFEELPTEQQLKDELFFAVVSAMSRLME